MKTTLYKIMTSDNLELPGLLYEPDSKTNKVLVHVHGMVGNFYENRFLDHIAETLTANGIAFYVFNNRGTEFIKDMYKVEDGKRSIVRMGDSYEKFEDCLIDIKAGIDFVDSKGFTDIHLSGHSLGGPKVAFYAADSGDVRVKSVIFLSPADMVGLAKADKDYERDITTAEKFVAQGRGREILPFDVWGDCILSAETYMNLATEAGKVAIFNYHNSEDELEVLGRIVAPVLTVVGRKDHVVIIDIEEIMRRTKEALKSSPKAETNILGDADHGYNGYEQELAEVIKNWLLSTSGGK